MTFLNSRLINKLRPGTIIRIDAKEDGFVRTSNVTKCLAAATILGVSASDIFQGGDLIEGTTDGLLRVARTVIALLRIAGDRPPVPPSKYLYGLGPGGIGLGHPSSSPYSSQSKASSSTPDLSTSSHHKRSVSPIINRSRLPPLPSDSLSERESSNGKSASASGKNQSTIAAVKDSKKPEMLLEDDSALASDDSEASGGNERFFDSNESVVVLQPPRPPRRDRTLLAAAATTTTTTTGGPSRETRASVASGSSQATNTTGFSSLMSPVSEMNEAADRSTNFGTIRTVTTEATSLVSSDAPSLSRPEASSVVASPSIGYMMHKDEKPSRRRSLDAQRNDAGISNPIIQSHKISFPMRDRRPSETAIVDLTRVAEEAEEGTLHPHAVKSNVESGVDAAKQARQPIQLGKGKWPDDFISAFSAPAPSAPIPIKNINDHDQRSDSPMAHTSPLTSLSISPPKFSPLNEQPLSESPRRPTHRSRHSVDTVGLLPKDTFGRDNSPDEFSQSTRVIPRRSSAKSNANRNGMYIPRTSSQSPSPDGSNGSRRVPFPRTISDQFPSSLPPEPVSAGVPGKFAHRGRFQSDIDDSTRRKPRPTSFDELSGKPRRSRIESMINLGGGSSNASASDLLRRDSMDSTAVRQTLIVREDGKSPTHFVSATLPDGLKFFH